MLVKVLMLMTLLRVPCMMFVSIMMMIVVIVMVMMMIDINTMMLAMMTVTMMQFPVIMVHVLVRVVILMVMMRVPFMMFVTVMVIVMKMTMTISSNSVMLVQMAVAMMMMMIMSHPLQQTHRVHESDPDGETQQLAESELHRGPFPPVIMMVMVPTVVEDVRQDRDRRQVDEPPRRDQSQPVPPRVVLQRQSDGRADHGRDGRSELRHDGLPLAEPVLDEDGKVPQFVGDLVAQNRQRGKTPPGSHQGEDG
jgi:hypothetical protein